MKKRMGECQIWMSKSDQDPDLDQIEMGLDRLWIAIIRNIYWNRTDLSKSNFN